MPEHPLASAVARAGISDPWVLAAVGSASRADFVPPELAAQADLDRPPPIPYDQVTTQPSLVARMVEALQLSGSERGRLVQPIGPGGDEDVVSFTKRDGHLHRLGTLTGARFVPLVGRNGFAS